MGFHPMGTIPADSEAFLRELGRLLTARVVALAAVAACSGAAADAQREQRRAESALAAAEADLASFWRNCGAIHG